MKAGPSSVRLFSKCAQSTMSRAASVNPKLLKRRKHPAMVPTRAWDRSQRVNYFLAKSLSAVAVEGVGAAPELKPERHRADFQVPAHRVEQIAPVAFRKLFEPIAEHHE